MHATAAPPRCATNESMCPEGRRLWQLSMDVYELVLNCEADWLDYHRADRRLEVHMSDCVRTCEVVS